MGYGTGYIDNITSSGNLTITTGTSVSGNITVSGTVTSNIGNIYPLVSTSSVNSTSGTTVTIATNIPSWVQRVTIITNGVSTNGTALPLIQLGYGATPTYQTSGYVSVGENYSTANVATLSSTAGYVIGCTQAATVTWNVLYTLINVPSSNTWIGSLSGATAGTVVFGGGKVTLSGVLTAIRLNTTNGTDTFDAGSVNIMYD